MMHNRKGRTFGRVKKTRVALMRSLARALILEGGIETTEAKAKELRTFIEPLVTKSKADSVASRRLVVARLGGDAEATAKLFADIAPRMQDRNGGYTRVVKTAKKVSDGRSTAYIAFV
jgi:large subunit ribosomal protein L17